MSENAKTLDELKAEAEAAYEAWNAAAAAAGQADQKAAEDALSEFAVGTLADDLRAFLVAEAGFRAGAGEQARHTAQTLAAKVLGEMDGVTSLDMIRIFHGCAITSQKECEQARRAPVAQRAAEAAREAQRIADEAAAALAAVGGEDK